MPERVAVVPPNDHLSRDLIIRELGGRAPLVTFLEQLCTDTVYVFKDDFDRGIDENRWKNGGFIWDPEDLEGHIHGTSVAAPDEDRSHTGLTLMGRIFGWKAGKRAVTMIRMRMTALSGIVEFGFADPSVDLTAGGVVLDKSALLVAQGLDDFSIAVRYVSDSAFFGIVTGGRDNAVGSGTNSKAVAIANTEFSLMLALNEQEETRLWVNGMPTDIEYTGPHRRADLALWLHVDDNSLDVDYIQAWQERVAV